MNLHATRHLVLSLFLSAVMSVVGCAAPQPPNPPTPHFEVEVETVEAQALAEVLATATTFVVPYEEEQAAWERVRLFLSSYASEQTVSAVRAGGGAVTLSSTPKRGSQDGYRYQIGKRVVSGGLEYTVQAFPVAPHGKRQFAERNARNLARFIRSGTLERSLLVR